MRILQSEPPEVRKRLDNDFISETRRYKLITPLFGGGVEPQKADPITVVRASEVRGHLRFWWRAINVGRFHTVTELRQRESEIWGSTEAPSQTQVKLIDAETKPGTPEVAFRVDRPKRETPSPKIAPYAAFSLLPDKEEQKRIGWMSEPVWVGVQFTVEFRYLQTMEEEIQSALWAWETFGGIGARTRRGFGALQWQDSPSSYPPQPAEIERRIRARLTQLALQTGKLENVPSLIPQLNLKITKAFDDPIAGWKDLISALQRFRQDRYGNKFGLSKWPEANEIRRLHGLPPRLPEGVQNTKLVPKFPRSAFGLPIVFHMAHDPEISKDPNLEGIPDQKSGIKYDRLASRLILRPLACSGDKYVGLVAILHAPSQPPTGLRLRDAPGDPVVIARLTRGEAQQIEPLSGTTDVLQAFLNSL